MVLPRGYVPVQVPEAHGRPVTDLHSRVLAAVEAREKIAKKAVGPRWESNGSWEIRTPPSGSINRNSDGLDWYQVFKAPDSEGQSIEEFRRRLSANADYVEAYDPYFALKSCARDFKVLERHVKEVLSSGVEACFWCSEDGYNPIVIRYPCIEIKDLAELYEVDL